MAAVVQIRSRRRVGRLRRGACQSPVLWCIAGTTERYEMMGDFTHLDRAALETMAGAGDELREVERVLRKSGDTIVGEALRGGGVFYEWHHYPEGDVYDPETHA